ncbi:hypothetical protein BRADI_3g47505v3 [Brachypodium distachyon]|uniref:Uncharacterized protein n=1 Tax=Brachypodium distachyon TaxID=15368 RepID=A0A2K2D3V2_BRADI|nr:hypothetical protein BRADI_3g47505v3 [Brachypodium distachyon]
MYRLSQKVQKISVARGITLRVLQLDNDVHFSPTNNKSKRRISNFDNAFTCGHHLLSFKRHLQIPDSFPIWAKSLTLGWSLARFVAAPMSHLFCAAPSRPIRKNSLIARG